MGRNHDDSFAGLLEGTKEGLEDEIPEITFDSKHPKPIIKMSNLHDQTTKLEKDEDVAPPER